MGSGRTISPEESRAYPRVVFPYSILLRHTVYRRQLAGVSGNILRTALVSIHLYEEDSRKDIQCSGAQHTRYIHRL